MIVSDQPTIFGNDITVALSSVDDGDMRFSAGNEAEARDNRIAFLSSVSIDPLQATLVPISYKDTTDFARYNVVDESHLGEGMLESSSEFHADALIATRPDHALFLPLADCAGTVLYDTVNHILMVSHIGRHSAEVDGARRSVEYLKNEFDSKPENVKVWISPAVGSETYPLHALNNRGLQDVIIEQLATAGILSHNIEASSVDTADSDNYFSHSEFLAGNRSEDGRFAIVAMMHD
jgi:copper oxidase (laccase) domain-containing protein